MFDYQLKSLFFKKIKRFVYYFTLFIFYIVNNGNILTDGRRRYRLTEF